MKTLTKKEAGKKPTTVTTSTPFANENQPGSYNLESVEAKPNGSRYSKPTNHSGNRVSKPADAIAAAYRELSRAQIQQAPPIREEKTLDLWYVGRNEAGEIVRVPRGTFRGVVELEVSRSGRFTSAPAETGGALLDRVMLEPSLDVRDEAIIEAIAQLLDEEHITDSQTIRVINDSVAGVCLRRAGLRLERPDQLAAIGKAHR
jgi:hypothetical protein